MPVGAESIREAIRWIAEIFHNLKALLKEAATLAITFPNPNQARLRITNKTGHKLPSGYPEGRRMWLNIKWYDGNGALLHEDGEYGSLTVDLDQDALADAWGAALDGEDLDGDGGLDEDVAAQWAAMIDDGSGGDGDAGGGERVLNQDEIDSLLGFDLDEQARVVHLMGRPDETRHLIVANEQAVISPSWSIHSGAVVPPDGAQLVGLFEQTPGFSGAPVAWTAP